MSSRIAGLDARVVGRRGPLVVMLHGYAAPPDDLCPFAEQLVERWPVRVLLPSGPVDYFGMVRAWWAIDERRHWPLHRADVPEVLEVEAPPGLDRARGRVLALLSEARRRFGGPPPLLVGFSQGAMLAADVALRTGFALSGLALLSGSVVASEAWARVPASPGPPTWIAHGRSDGLLPARLADRLEARLRARGWPVHAFRFDGGHHVPPVEAMSGWLRTVAPWGPRFSDVAPIGDSCHLYSAECLPIVRRARRPLRSS